MSISRHKNLGITMRTLFLFLLLAIVPAHIIAADDKPTLASCALRYGQLMADHWLTVDLAHQIERAVSYLPKDKPAPTGDLEKLQLWLAAAEQQLNDARARYKILFATNSAPELAALSKLLDDTGADEAGNQ